MTPGQLVKAVSVALDVSEETVVQHDRNLVVAGLRTTGARGRNAPSVTHRDAARLVAAVMGSVKVRDSVPVVSSLEVAKASWPRDPMPSLLPKLAELPKRHNFIDGLTAILDEVDTPQMFEDFAKFADRFSTLRISVSEGSAEIAHWIDGVGSASIPYLRPYTRADGGLPSKEGKKFPWQWSDFAGLEQERKIRGNCLMILGLCFQRGVPELVAAAFRTWRSAAKKAAA